MPNLSSDSRELDIEFRNVTKRFDDVVAVDNVSLSVERGAFFTFLGPSGCGKTTSLRLIAGFDQPTEGDVFISGSSVVGVPSHKRPVNMVFQQYALFPHMDVTENIGYGLRQRNPKPGKQEVIKRVDETLEMVRLSGYGKRRAWELSGGQQQRVALARALINHPTCLLLDEPLAALDRKLRREMQIELQTLQREVGITFILVTHDQEEALSMSDRICIMRDGRIVQSGSPRELYDEPISRYVADFVGKTNFFNGIVAETSDSRVTVKCDSGEVLVRAMKYSPVLTMTGSLQRNCTSKFVPDSSVSSPTTRIFARTSVVPNNTRTNSLRFGNRARSSRTCSLACRQLDSCNVPGRIRTLPRCKASRLTPRKLTATRCPGEASSTCRL